LRREDEDHAGSPHRIENVTDDSRLGPASVPHPALLEQRAAEERAEGFNPFFLRLDHGHHSGADQG